MNIGKGWIYAGIAVILILAGLAIYGVFKEKTVIVQGIPKELYDSTIKKYDDQLKAKEIKEQDFIFQRKLDSTEIAYLKNQKPQILIKYIKDIEQYNNADSTEQINLLEEEYNKHFGGQK